MYQLSIDCVVLCGVYIYILFVYKILQYTQIIVVIRKSTRELGFIK